MVLARNLAVPAGLYEPGQYYEQRHWRRWKSWPPRAILVVDG
jgi:hypothetical protein